MPLKVGESGLSSVTLLCLVGLDPLIFGEHMLLPVLSTDLSLHMGKICAGAC